MKQTRLQGIPKLWESKLNVVSPNPFLMKIGRRIANDRIIVATALAHRLAVVPSDKNIRKYPGIDVLW